MFLESFLNRLDFVELVKRENYVPDAYFTAYRKWWEEIHNVSFKEEWMIFSNGIVAAISSIIRKLTTIGEWV